MFHPTLSCKQDPEIFEPFHHGAATLSHPEGSNPALSASMPRLQTGKALTPKNHSQPLTVSVCAGANKSMKPGCNHGRTQRQLSTCCQISTAAPTVILQWQNDVLACLYFFSQSQASWTAQSHRCSKSAHAKQSRNLFFSHIFTWGGEPWR